jgi:hypothetical protein
MIHFETFFVFVFVVIVVIDVDGEGIQLRARMRQKSSSCYRVTFIVVIGSLLLTVHIGNLETVNHG